MKAVIWTRYGPPEVLQLQEIEKPAPKDDQVLIKIHATSVTAGDCEARALKFSWWLTIPMRAYIGLRKPTRVRVLGMELAGEIEEVGSQVTGFAVGDRVFVVTDFSFGGYAEYKVMAAEPSMAAIAHLPPDLSYEEGAAAPVGGLEALHFLGMARIRPGESVLINGAGGSIGTMGIQLAKHDGAEVTAVDSTPKLEMMRRIGADHVVDYTREDFADQGKRYDVIFDVIGKRSFARCIRSLKPNGRYLMANPKLSTMARGRWIGWTSKKQIHFKMAEHTREEMLALRKLLEAGVIKPVIDRRYPLEEIVDAHRYVETGRKQGCVVIDVV